MRNTTLSDLFDQKKIDARLDQIANHGVGLDELDPTVVAAFNGTGTVPPVNSLDGTMLKSTYSYKGTLTNENVNSIRDSGLYYCADASGLTGMPSGVTGAILFEVGQVTDSYLFQRIYDISSQYKVFHRIARYGWWNGPWYQAVNVGLVNGITTAMLAGSITRAKLVDNILTSVTNLGTGTNVNSVVAEGRYFGLATNTYTNIPTAMVGQSFYLDVYVYGSSGSFVIQKMTLFRDPRVVYARYVETGIDPGAWQKLKLSAESRISSLFGGKVACFGDSITGYYNYPTLLATALGATVYNCGFGGTRMAQHSDSNYDKFCMYQIADAILDGDFTAQDAAKDAIVSGGGPSFNDQLNALKSIDFSTLDAMIIFHGTNDYAGNVGIGANSDGDGTTFKGAINMTINKILTAYPRIKIFFVTPMYRNRYETVDDGHTSDVYANPGGLYLADYATAIDDVAALNHQPSLNMLMAGGINKYNHATYLEDGLHPTATYGTPYLANKIGAFVAANI